MIRDEKTWDELRRLEKSGEELSWDELCRVESSSRPCRRDSALAFGRRKTELLQRFWEEKDTSTKLGEELRRQDEKRRADMRRHELRKAKAIWNRREKRRDETRKHQVRWDEMRSDEVGRHGMRWGEMRWEGHLRKKRPKARDAKREEMPRARDVRWLATGAKKMFLQHAWCRMISYRHILFQTYTIDYSRIYVHTRSHTHI